MEGGSPSRIQDPGAIPTDVVCLSNLFQSSWSPRILDERFLGLGNPMRLLSEWGIPIVKRTQKTGQGRTRDVFDPVDPRAASEWLCRLFVSLWDRVEDFREPLQEDKRFGILLYHDGRVAPSLLSAMAQAILPKAWFAAHADLPRALSLRTAQDSGVDYWIRRPVRRNRGVTDRVFKMDRMTHASRLMAILPVPLPPWTDRKPASVLEDGPPPPGIFLGSVEDIPDEWGTWWIPGTGGVAGSKGDKVLRDRWSAQEWLFAKTIGARCFDEGGFVASDTVPITEIFPAVNLLREALSPLSWIDSHLMGMIPRLLEYPLDAQGHLSPARIWLRGQETLLDMHHARSLREMAQNLGVPMEVMGYGAGKVHITHNMGSEEWQDFCMRAHLDGWILTPVIPKENGA